MKKHMQMHSLFLITCYKKQEAKNASEQKDQRMTNADLLSYAVWKYGKAIKID